LELSRVDASAGRLQDVERDVRNTVRNIRALLFVYVLLCICSLPVAEMYLGMVKFAQQPSELGVST